MTNKIKTSIELEHKNIQKENAKKVFSELIQNPQYVGELFSINYETAKVQIHDNERKKVGGIPSLSFLIATRINVESDEMDFKEEDASIILLRVKDAAPLPNSSEAERIRVESAQRISGETDKHWDADGVMDTKTRVYLGYAGLECRIIGTFFLDAIDEENPESPLQLKFGSDISNYYPNRGLKVYKPNATALQRIVNYVDPKNVADHFEKYGNRSTVELGNIRYASTNRKYQHIDGVPVSIYPADLLSQKTALFGMTRTGKSNTTKIIAKSVYELRFPAEGEGKSLRIGQLIFDPNGEYANENVQDNNNALKNIWSINCSLTSENERKEYKNREIVTYGLLTHPNDPDRILMLLNFYTTENLQIGKEIIDNMFSNDDPIYIKNFMQIVFEAPDLNDRSAVIRYNRRILAYRSILFRAGFTPPTTLRPQTSGLFNQRLVQALQQYTGDDEITYHSAATILQNNNPTWGQVADAFEAIEKFIRNDSVTGYNTFENWYVNQRPNASGDKWAEEDFKKLIGIFQYPNGIRRIGRASNQHTHLTTTDYAVDIYRDLEAGKLVIIDQSSGSPELNESSSRRIMQRIFDENKSRFTSGQTPPDIMVYVEEAHNLLPPDKEKDYRDIWVRTAKEGAKLRIGMVYATQEVSSIQKNILKNTANWFIGHLNNTDETKELCKYYDFADFEPSIRRAQDKGFLRVKTLSNPFVIPVQIKFFTVEE
ncbi:MAG: DUF87 domain-containing protein [Ignavibacteriales bacterium]|nr:DUF87 domain-containing protein [Ignavibacteriales bacterium]